MRKLALTLASFVAFCSCPPAFSGTAVATNGVVGVSIGTDLTVDPGFGDQGYTVVNYNDDGGTWDEAVRVLPRRTTASGSSAFTAPTRAPTGSPFPSSMPTAGSTPRSAREERPWSTPASASFATPSAWTTASTSSACTCSRRTDRA